MRCVDTSEVKVFRGNNYRESDGDYHKLAWKSSSEGH